MDYDKLTVNIQVEICSSRERDGGNEDFWISVSGLLSRGLQIPPHLPLHLFGGSLIVPNIDLQNAKLKKISIYP